MNRYIGIDLGTSSVKILLVCANGEIEKTVSREYPISYPHSGWSEQNPSDWYEQTIDGLKELLSGAVRIGNRILTANRFFNFAVGTYQKNFN